MAYASIWTSISIRDLHDKSIDRMTNGVIKVFWRYRKKGTRKKLVEYGSIAYGKTQGQAQKNINNCYGLHSCINEI